MLPAVSPHETRDPPRASPPRWFQRHELGTLVALAGIAAAVLVFVRLAQYVGTGEVAGLDTRLVLALRHAEDPSDPIGPSWLEEGVRDVTALGGLGVLALVALGSIGYLLLQQKRATAVMAVVAVGGGVALSLLLKDVFDRPRPELVPHGTIVHTQSFPSGHSMLSAVTYLTLGAVLARIQSSWYQKLYVLALAVAVTLAVGASRVYLGVHWPSDVVAGWAAGTTWAALVWWVTHRLQRKGNLEPDPAEAPGLGRPAS
jgi:undecaprenyl-diphosphatase